MHTHPPIEKTLRGTDSEREVRVDGKYRRRSLTKGLTFSSWVLFQPRPYSDLRTDAGSQ